MYLKDLLKIAEMLLKYYPPDAEVWLDDENVMVLSNGEKKRYSTDEVMDIKNEAEINWDGISSVRAWSKGGKQRLYFRAVGIPDGAHKSGKVFLELVNGNWMPNMKYNLMTSLAYQLNEMNLFDAEEIADKYRDFLDSDY